MEVRKEVNRRDALKLAAGAAALGAALGVPRSVLALEAKGGPAAEFGEKIFLKFYYSGKLWNSLQLTDEQARQLGDSPGALAIKLFRGASETLGATSFTPEVQVKIRSFLKVSR